MFCNYNQRLSDNIPRTFKEALQNPFASEWLEAVEHEFKSHEEHQMWVATNIPNCKTNLLNTKWIFTVKAQADGSETLKARLVAIGCNDQNEYTITEKSSPVCPIDIIMLLLSLVHERNMKLATMDITTAYLISDVTCNAQSFRTWVTETTMPS